MAEPDIAIISAELRPNLEQFKKAGMDMGITAGKAYAKGFAQPLGSISSKASEFQKSLEASTARVVAFGASTGSIYAVGLAFRKLVSSTVEVESALTDINTLLKLGSNDLSKFSAGLFQVANSVSVSFADAAKVAQEFSRQGLSVENTLKRTAAALTLVKLSGLSADSSVAALTATINAFNKEALDEVDIVNRLANVDANFAVSARDLAEGIKRASSAASDAGVGFSQLLALITSAKQITQRDGAVIGNSLKTIFTRLERPQVLDDLEATGVKIRDLSGKALPLIQVLKNLSATYDTLASGQKSFVAETVGGVYQINILKAILNDLGSGVSIYDGAIKAASESTGIANIRINALNETISSRLIRTFNDLTEAAANVGTIAFEPTIKGGLESFSGLVKAFNNFNVIGDNAGMGESISKSLIQGFEKGLGSIASGPGIQLVIAVFIKLFSKLKQYLIDSFKELSGLSDKVNQTVAFEQSITRELITQKGVLSELLTGNLSLNNFAQDYLNKVRAANLEMQEASILAKSIASGTRTGSVSNNSTIGSSPSIKTTSVPGLSMRNYAIEEALKRENLATGGNAVLSQSSLLVSPSNPYGFVAIDKKNQRSGDDAVRQHLIAGQSMTQIRNAKSSSIPNLAIDSGNSIMISTVLGILQGANFKKDNFDGIHSKLKSSLGSLFTFLDKQSREEDKYINLKKKSIKTESDWINAREKERKLVIENAANKVESRVEFPLQKGVKAIIRNPDDFNRVVQPEIEKAQARINEFRERSSNRSERIRNAGFTAAIGGGIAGGMLSSAVGKNNPDAAAGIDEFTSGVITAGQVLTVFQTPVAKAVAGFFALNSALNGIDTGFKGLEGQRKGLDQEQSKTQKMVANIDIAISSLSTLSSLYTDSSVNLETLNREQRKYSDAISQISAMGGRAGQLANSIQTAPDNTSRIGLLSFAKELENRKLNESSGLFQLKELASEKTSFGKYGAFGGIFAATNTTDRNRSASLIQGNAGNILQSLSDEQKEGLIKNVGKSSVFQNILSGNDVAKDVFSTIRESGGNESDINLIVQQMRLLIGNQAANRNQGVTDARNRGIKANEAAQFNVDIATRNLNSFKKLFLNLGSLQANNSLDIQSQGSRDTFNKSSVFEAKRRAQTGLVGFLSGDRTVASFERDTESQKIEAEKVFKISSLKNKFSRDIVGNYSQNLDLLGKPSERMSKDKLNPNIIEAPSHTENVLRALNEGLAKVATQDLSGLINEDGGFNFQDFEKRVVAAGGGDATTSKQLEKYLQGNRSSMDFQKVIQGQNNEMVDVLQEQLKEERIQNVKFDALIKEMDVKRQANFLGGSKLLGDRGFRREAQRELQKGLTLVDKGRTLEQRAQGAQILLKNARENGRDPLEIAKRVGNKFIPKNNSRASQEAAMLLNLEAAGLQQQQERVVGGLRGNRGGLGSSFVRGQYFSPLANQRMGRDALAGAAVAAENKVEMSDVSNIVDSKDKETASTIGLSQELEVAKTKVAGFGDNLIQVASKIGSAFKDLNLAKEQQRDTNKSVADEIGQAVAKAIKELNAPKDNEQIKAAIPEKTMLEKVNGAIFNKTTLSGAGIAAFLALRSTKEGRENFRGNLNKVFDPAKRVGGKIAGLFKGDTTDYTNTGEGLSPSIRDPKIKPISKRDQNIIRVTRDDLNSIRVGREDLTNNRRSKPTIRIPMSVEILNQLTNEKVKKEGLYNEKRAAEIPFFTKTSIEEKKRMFGPSKGTIFDRMSTFGDGPDFIKEKGELTRKMGKATTSTTTNPTRGWVGPLATKGTEFLGPFFPADRDTKIGKDGGLKLRSGRNRNGNEGGFINLSPLMPVANVVGNVTKTGFNLGRKGLNSFGSNFGQLAEGYLPGATALFAGGTAGASLAAAPILGAAAIGATAYGGFKGGQSLYRAFNSKSFEGIQEGSDLANSALYTSVIKDFKKGKSVDEVRKTVLAQINTDKQSLDSLGGNGAFGSAHRFLSGTQQEGDITKDSIAKNEELLKSLGALKESIDEQNAGKSAQDKLIAALEKIGNGGANSSDTKIMVEISLKDADKLPEIFSEKIIKPLQEQLRNLGGKVGTIENKVGINPSPAPV
jgi:TP901 family phage tail tape measure protein